MSSSSSSGGAHACPSLPPGGALRHPPHCGLERGYEWFPSSNGAWMARVPQSPTRNPDCVNAPWFPIVSIQHAYPPISTSHPPSREPRHELRTRSTYASAAYINDNRPSIESRLCGFIVFSLFAADTGGQGLCSDSEQPSAAIEARPRRASDDLRTSTPSTWGRGSGRVVRVPHVAVRRRRGACGPFFGRFAFRSTAADPSTSGASTARIGALAVGPDVDV